MNTTVWLLGFLGLLLSSDGFGQVADWRTFTSVGTIKEMVSFGDLVWAGSDGGALSLDTNSNEITKITNTDGLTSNDVVAVAVDKSGSIWFALFDGVLNRFFPETGEWEVIEDYRDQTVSDIVVFGDSLYVGLDIGVSLYTIDKKEVKETYQNLGLSSGDDLEKIGANSIFIDGTDIWVTTDKGIGLSSLTLVNLQAPSSWSQFRREEGLGSLVVHDLVVLGNTPYAATAAGVSRLRAGRWEDAGLGTGVNKLQVVKSNQFFPENTVVAVTSGGAFWLDPSGIWQRLGPQLNDVTAIVTNESGNVWIGRQNRGIAQFDFSSNVWDLVSADGPASNDFADLLVDSQGRLWCTSAQSGAIRGGVFMYDGNTWTNFSSDNGLPSNDYRTIVEDSRGRIWAGSWGGGVSIFEDDGAGFTIAGIDTADGLLAGFSATSPAFVLVNGITRDQDDNIWLLNRLATNTRVLVAYTPDDRWVHFSTSAGGLTSRLVNNIEVDLAGRVWVGTDDRGISVLDHNNSLFDLSDDDFSQGLTTSDGLFANEITAMAEDEDGVFWVGSNVGLNLYFNQESLDEFNLISNAITAIGVDGRNNKWIGTINGITVLRGHLDKIADFTTGNSPLVSGNIQAFAFNSETGEVWIGTDKGLSLAQTFFTAPRENLSQLSGFPNPFVIDGRQVFTITNLAENTSVTIFNSAGAFVRDFESSNDIQGAQAIWDGKDNDGNLVASGVYVYLAHTDNDVSATGKVAVIRR